MDLENTTLEDQCEHLMNIVVESRKRFGKMCAEYEQKSSLIENKSLNLQLETIANYRFKTKTQLPNIDAEEMLQCVDKFSEEIKTKHRRIDNLKQSVRNTQTIVLQLKSDKIGEKLKQPLTAEAMLNAVKNKNDLLSG